MLEINLKQLVSRIVEVERSHLNTPSDEAMMSNNWKFIFDEFDEWVVLGVPAGKFDGYWIYPKYTLKQKSMML